MKTFFIIITTIFLTACQTTPTEGQKQTLQRHYDQLHQTKVANDSLNAMNSIDGVSENHPRALELANLPM